jgi:lipopolysaccharide/colanic/teichoic acid biosynthesis glycosyltransferase
LSANTVVVTSAPDIQELQDLFIGPPSVRTRYLLLKRAIDLILSAMLLIIACPIMLLSAILIKLESDGPAIYIQQRVGARYRRERGRIVWELCLFPCYKLRTMRKDSDPEIHKEYLRRFRNGGLEDSPKGALFKLSQDRRVTIVGQWLRKSSLDELPQLFNVIKGEMSLVGPRPVPVYEVELYDRPHYDRLAARPGITGVWQVYGRSRVTFEQMVAMDSGYVRQSSLMFDFKLLVMTIVSVVSSKGAA